MLRFLTNLLKTPDEIVLAPTSKENVLLITAYLNQGVVVVSHKGEIHKGFFDNGILRKMIKGADFERRKYAIEQFLGGLAKLIINFNTNGKTIIQADAGRNSSGNPSAGGK